MKHLAAVVLAFLGLSAAPAGAQEIWAGQWVDPAHAQHGRLEFVVTAGAMNGRITNGRMVGRWVGRVQRGARLIADYAYPGFAAPAVGRVLQHDRDHIAGHLVFMQAGRVFGEGEFEMRMVGSSAPPSIVAGPVGPPSSAMIPRPYAAMPPVAGTAAPVPGVSGTVAGTMGMVNTMMHDALHGDPAAVTHKYSGMNALAAGAAAQNQVYNSVINNDRAWSAREQASQAMKARMMQSTRRIAPCSSADRSVDRLAAASLLVRPRAHLSGPV
jgi:hypothetical protein